MDHPPPFRRTVIGLILALGVAGVLTGCDDQANSFFDLPGANSEDRPSHAQQIAIGPASQYRKSGLYDRFLDDHGFLLVSRPASGGQMLVALRAVCPNDHANVRYDDATDLLRCSRCDSQWTTDGLIRDGSVARRSLARLRLNLDHSLDSNRKPKSSQTMLLVDPSRLYRRREVQMVDGQKVIRQEWSATDSMYLFAQDPRHRRLSEHVDSP